MTTNVRSQKLPSPAFLGLTILVYAVSIVLSYLSLPAAYPELSIGIAFDLALAAPLFFYLAIRRTRISRLSVAAAVFTGVATATFLLPKSQVGPLNFITFWVLPLLELAIIGFVGYKAYLLARNIRKNKRQSEDMLKILSDAVFSVFGESRFAFAVAYEMSVIYYAFTPASQPRHSDTTFTYHKTRGTGAIYAVIIFLVTVESVVLHVVVSIWSGLAAWILTSASVYFLIFLVAQMRAARYRPIMVRDGSLSVRCGIICDVEIPLSEIEQVEEIPAGSTSEYDHEAAFLRGFERHNLVIRLTYEAESRGPYGLKTKFRSIAAFVDDKDRFIKRVVTG